MSRLHRARKAMQKLLVPQAVSLGIIDLPSDAKPIDESAVSLDAFRARKAQQGN